MFHCTSLGECGVVTVCSGIILVIDGSSSVKESPDDRCGGRVCVLL